MWVYHVQVGILETRSEGRKKILGKQRPQEGFFLSGIWLHLIFKSGIILCIEPSHHFFFQDMGDLAIGRLEKQDPGIRLPSVQGRI